MRSSMLDFSELCVTGACQHMHPQLQHSGLCNSGSAYTQTLPPAWSSRVCGCSSS